MKSPYVSELQPNVVVTSLFLVQSKDIRQKKSGEPYLSLILGDRTGEIEAKMWDNASEVMDTFDRDDFLRVKGLLQVFHNRLQMTVHKLQKQPVETVDFTDFYPASHRDLDEMYGELRGIVAGIGNQHLRALVSAVIEDPDIASRLRVAPAAKNVHHAYLGGLLEHVLSMAGLAKLTAGHYRDIDLDLLLSGVLLHDIGKIHELTWDRSFGYSSEGQLLGHIYLGLRIIDEKMRSIGEFPVRLRTLLEHMILSHHGELAYGSPKIPVFPEALLLHHIDNLDSRMECMRSLLEKDRFVEGCWTSYNNTLERCILKKRKYLEDTATPQAHEVEKGAAQTAKVLASDEARVSAAIHRQPSQPQPLRQQQQSPFAEKLLGALGKDR